MFTLFIIGFLEMIICTIWTKVVSKSQVWASGAVTLIEIVVWYYVIQTVVSDINNWKIILAYALGCALGTMVSTLYFQLSEKITRANKRNKKKLSWKKVIINALTW
jgi:uncharacterized protein YebE (UPF0316 family)